MKILKHYISPLWKIVLLSLFLATINQVFSLLDPLIFQKVIDNYALRFHEYNRTDFIQGVLWLIALIIGTAFVSRVAKNFQDYYVNTITQKVGAKIYTEGIRHALSLPYHYFEDERSGSFLGKLDKARGDTERLIQLSVNTLFTTLVSFTFIIIYSIKTHWSIAPVWAVTIIVILGASTLLSKKIKTVQAGIVAETASLKGGATESIRNIELVKSLGLTDQEIERLNTITEKLLALELKKVKYIRILSFIQGTIVNFMRSIILFLLVWLVFKQIISVGQLLSLFFYSFSIFFALQEFGNNISTYYEAQASLDSFEKLLKVPKEITPKNPQTVILENSIAFQNVSFRHQTSAVTDSVSDISFTAYSGETIAFVGPSGAGKSTIIKILVGLYIPSQGSVVFDDTPLSEINRDLLRTQFGIVTQETQLFAGTIRENLVFAKPDATDNECIEALTQASCLGIIERGGVGLDTRIGEGGMKLSGGERQRLAIARAILRKPKLLIFDEATSSLDSLTEEEITKTIRDVSKSKNRITVLIAHRLSTIMHADKIFVLEKGSITETGTHAELLDKKGLYSAMWREQIGERV